MDKDDKTPLNRWFSGVYSSFDMQLRIESYGAAICMLVALLVFSCQDQSPRVDNLQVQTVRKSAADQIACPSKDLLQALTTHFTSAQSSPGTMTTIDGSHCVILPQGLEIRVINVEKNESGSGQIIEFTTAQIQGSMWALAKIVKNED